ncbi:BirA family transcriptional regulator, biotin operon repressor / biotin-[acetyl-CoA-carboxylase] ligase [Nocardioides terrae]|uniref:biotin--[biotin carboxyl-carrier protein] ligase n=1 Tax=Nocardioides terrae TaxID=574651 RepID=A0A1I1DMQ1_9ACTN|nr:BirA family transcriptional regulator, biotin operon repressor / biotin-[acetyl-CoA-carboxylase] ligase [Nocardioides terrae]
MRIATGDDPFVVEILPETPSTNAVLAQRARQGAPEGLVVVTEHQTAGRGRLDRTWETPLHSALTFSVLLRPPAEQVPAERWPWLPLLAGLAVTTALREEGYAAGVKWPNDVLVAGADGDRKVCGILVERIEAATGSTSGPGPAAVVGIGINTSLTAEELPVPTATSLAIESGGLVDRTAVLRHVLRVLFEHYADWVADSESLRPAYVRASATLGREVRAELPGGGTLVGTATAVDATGRLVVTTPQGDRVVGAGDVVHLRPAR